MPGFDKQRLGASILGLLTGSLSFSNHIVDNAAEGVAWSVQAEDAGAITHIGFRYGARTGTPPTYIIGLESPQTSDGKPNGTYLGGGSPASATFTPPADTTWDGKWQWIALANSYTPTRGQFLMPTIRYSSGTINAINYSTFTTHATGVLGAGVQSYPVAWRNTSGTWAGQSSPAFIGLRTSSTRYGCLVESYYNTRTASTVGRRVALEFSIPSSVCSSFTIRGLRFNGSISSASGKAPVVGLWSASGVLQNVTLDADYDQFPTSTSSLHEYHFDESSLANLLPDTTYYLGLEVADSTSGGVLVNGVGVGSADDLLCYPGGTEWRLATYDGSAWTSNTVTRPNVEIVLGALTGSAAGGAASLINGGLVG